MFHDEFSRPFSVVPSHARCFAEEDSDAGGDPGADPDPDDKDWKTEYGNEAVQSRKYRLRAQQAEKDLADARANAVSQEDLDELTRLQAAEAERTAAEEEAERARQAKAGEFDALAKAAEDKHSQVLEQKDKKHTEALADRDAQIAGQAAALQRATAEAQLVAELAKQGCEDPQEAAFLIFNRHEVFPQAVIGDDHKVTVQIVDRDGNEVIDKEADGEFLGMDGCVRGFLGTTTGQRFLPPSGDTGSGSHRGAPGGPLAGITQAVLLADPDKHVNFLEKHGADAFGKLPRK